MPEGWTWDPSLFRGSASYYLQGRLPYPPGLHDAFASAADLSGRPRLLDVGCGPGIVAVLLADLFTEVIGVDPDAEMLHEAGRLAAEHGVTNVRWVEARAEELDDAMGSFRYATFAASFHWMDRDAVAGIIFRLLEPGGAFVLVSTNDQQGRPLLSGDTTGPVPFPEAPDDAIAQLRDRYLGPVRRAGQGHLRFGSPNNEWGVLQRQGFMPARTVRVPSDTVVERTADDVVASVLSSSSTAPHLFGDRLPDFEADLRDVLARVSPSGRFSARSPDAELIFYHRPC